MLRFSRNVDVVCLMEQNKGRQAEVGSFGLSQVVSLVQLRGVQEGRRQA